MEEVRDPMARSIDAGSITPQIVRPVKPVRVARPTRATGLASPVQPVKSCQPSNPVPSTVTNNFHFSGHRHTFNGIPSPNIRKLPFIFHLSDLSSNGCL